MERRITGTVNNNGQRLEYRDGLLMRSVEEGLSCECTYIKCGDKDLLSSKVISIAGGESISYKYLYNKNGELLQMVEYVYRDNSLENLNVITIIGCNNGIYKVHKTYNGDSHFYDIVDIGSLIAPVHVYCIKETSKPAKLNVKVSVDTEEFKKMVDEQREAIARAFCVPACYL